jgi:hypothetical protein
MLLYRFMIITETVSGHLAEGILLVETAAKDNLLTLSGLSHSQAEMFRPAVLSPVCCRFRVSGKDK